MRLATTLEASRWGTGLAAGGGAATPAMQSAIAQIAANEAQHYSLLSLRRTDAAVPRRAFPDTMTMEVSSNALDKYTA
jgi:hypothetical protein